MTDLDPRYEPPPIGTELGLFIDSTIRWARLVAIRKSDDVRHLSRCIVREYRPDDVDGIPTGEYRTTAASWLRPRRERVSS